MRSIRFTFLCNEYERQLIARLAKMLQRTQGDTVRLLVRGAAKELKVDDHTAIDGQIENREKSLVNGS